jgi:hypothetical protein
MKPELYGMVAEFADADALLQAANGAYLRGFRKMDAFTPCPVEGLAEAVGMQFNGVPLLCLGGGLTGAAVAYGMQAYSAIWDYPLNVGGRPLHSWPSFIVITFELTVLFAALAAAFGMLVLNRLPQPHHPIFNTPHYRERSSSRFYLALEARDPVFEANDARALLEEHHPLHVWEVSA